jgi:hypothetical protein
VIARVWHGYTKSEHADAYESMAEAGAFAGHRQGQRIQGQLLASQKGWEEIEFITIMLWDSIESIRAVAGQDYETAVVHRRAPQVSCSLRSKVHPL